MGHEDIEPITELIRETAKGRTVLIVEHNLSVVSSLSDCITVLQNGEILAEGTYDEVSANQDVMTAYMGVSMMSDVPGKTSLIVQDLHGWYDESRYCTA